MYLWKKFVACWIVLGKTILFLRLVPLMFLVCMHYGIFSIPLNVLCNSHIIHVVTIMLYSLAYCEILVLSLVELMVCVCNWIIKICGCRLIGRKEFLIVWENLDWLLTTVLIYVKYPINYSLKLYPFERILNDIPFVIRF